MKQSGAVEACWAHNSEVRRSKLRSARNIFYIFYMKMNVLLEIIIKWLLNSETWLMIEIIIDEKLFVNVSTYLLTYVSTVMQLS